MQLPRIVRDFSFQAVGSYLTAALQMLRGILLAGMLGPTGLGNFAMVGLVLAYSQYADLGITLAVGREIPLALGEGREQKAQQWRWYALVCKLIAEAVFACILAVALVVGWDSWPAGLRFGLVTALVVVILQGVVVVTQTVLRARQLFLHEMVVTVTLAITLTLGMVAGGVSYGIRGVFVGQLLGFVLAACLGLALWGMPRAGRLQLRRVKQLLTVGVPLAMLTFMGYNLIYVDQVMVLWLLGRRELGIYSLALYAGSALFLLPASVAGAVSPRLLRRYGEQPAVEAIRAYTWRPVGVLSLALPPAIMVVWLVAPIVIVAFLPDFGSVIAPLRIYVVGMFFLGLNYGVSSTLIALNKHRYNIPILLACVTLNVVLDIALVAGLGLGLEGVAVGSLVTYSVYWMAHTTLVRWFFDERPASAVRRNLETGWPGLVLVVLLLLVGSTGRLGEVDAVLSTGLLVLTTAMSLARWRFGLRRVEAA